MAYQQRDNSGNLFKSREKKTDKHPDYSGEIMVAGTLYRIAAWLKDGKSGKFMSLAVTPATDKPAPKNDDTIPF
jgi:hypothetical protein